MKFEGSGGGGEEVAIEEVGGVCVGGCCWYMVGGVMSRSRVVDGVVPEFWPGSLFVCRRGRGATSGTLGVEACGGVAGDEMIGGGGGA